MKTWKTLYSFEFSIGEKVGPARVDDTPAHPRSSDWATRPLSKNWFASTIVPCSGLAIHLTGSQEDGQDIYQEAFLRAYINIGSFRFECSFYTWIYRIVTNLCLDHLRKRSSRYRDLTTTISSDGEEEQVLDHIADQRAGTSPERNMASRELRGCIVRAMQRLSPRERVVFELKHYHGLRLRTVAGILNTSEGTIKNTLFRATHKLRTQLAAVR